MESPRGVDGQKGVERPAVVLIVINDFLIGGAQKIVIELLKHLDRSRFTPVLLTCFQFSENANEYLYADIPNDVRSYHLRFGGFRDVGSWIALIKVLRMEKPRVVLSNLFFSNTILRVLKPFFRYNIITVEHNTYTEKTWLQQRVDALLARITSRIVAVSKTVAEFTAMQEGIPRDAFVVIHNGIDFSALEHVAESGQSVKVELGLSEADKIIINVARVVPQKNHALLLDGFAIFSKTHPEYHLVIVGGGSHLEKMKRYAECQGIRDVHFLGYRDDVPRLLKGADFFVSTSRIEGFGIAHAEALACGIPVLTTKTAGPDEMIHDGVNGFFITEHTTQAVVDGLERMVKSDRASMSRAASLSAKEFSVEKMIHEYESLLSTVISGVRLPRA